MDPGMVKNLAMGAIPPALIAGAYFAAAWRRRPAPGDDQEPRERAADWRAVATPLVMAAGVLLTYTLVFGAPKLRPSMAFQWLPYIVLAAGAAGSAATIKALPALVRWAPTAGALLFGAWASARGRIAGAWSGEMTAAHMLESLLVGAVVLAAAHATVSSRKGVAPVLVLMLFAGATCQLLILGYFSMKVGQVAGMAASMLIAAAAVSVWRPAFRLGAGGTVFVVVLALTTLGQGNLYGEAPPELARVYTALLLLSLVGTALVGLSLPERLGSKARGVALVGVAALPLLAGLGVAGKKWIGDQQQREQEAAEDPYADYLP